MQGKKKYEKKFTHRAGHNSSLYGQQKMVVKNIPHMNIHLHIISCPL